MLLQHMKKGIAPILILPKKLCFYFAPYMLCFRSMEEYLVEVSVYDINIHVSKIIQIPERVLDVEITLITKQQDLDYKPVFAGRKIILPVLSCPSGHRLMQIAEKSIGRHLFQVIFTQKMRISKLFPLSHSHPCRISD